MSWSSEPWRAQSGRSTRGGESSNYSIDQQCAGADGGHSPSRLRVHQQHRTWKLRRTPVERVERISSGPPCRSRYHLIGKFRTSTTIRVSGAHDVIGRLEAKFFCRNELLENRGNPVTGKLVGSIEDPCEFHGNLAAYEAGPFRCELRQQHTGCFCLPRIVIHQVPHQNIRVDRDHRSFAPSATARSMSSSVTGGPSCLNAPNSRERGRMGIIRTSLLSNMT